MASEFDVVVVGGGIAGMTAGLTSARLGRSTLVLTGCMPGGQLLSIDRIDGFPGFPDGVPGYELCPTTQEQAAAAGAEFMITSLEGIEGRERKWCVATAESDVVARTLIVATGSTLKTLDVPGEQRLVGKGASQCASCDGPLFRDRIVAVIGGGDSAMQEALTLAQFAAKVIILHRAEALDGQAYYRDRVTADAKIELRCNTTVTEIVGDTKVTGLRTLDGCSGAGSDVEVAAVFTYVGLRPNSGFLDGQISLDAAGRIPTDELTRTELIGVCAAGTVRRHSPCRAVSAAGDGASAAVAVDRYLTDDFWGSSVGAQGQP